MEFKHVPVMPKEALEGLNVRPGGIYVDATLGGGGHTSGILEKLGDGILIAFDLDENALKNARARFPGESRLRLVNDNFKNMPYVLDEMGIGAIDGVIFDLGISSPQIDDPKRGFSGFTPSLLHPKTVIRKGILANDCGSLMSDFFREKRK